MSEALSDALVFFGATGDLAHKKIFPALQSLGVKNEMDAYERLLGDAMKGDATLFAREDAVEAEWRIVEPLLANPPAPHEYDIGTWGPVEADRLIERSGGWHQPRVANRPIA